MNWRAGEGHIQRNTLEKKPDEIQRLNTANFEWQFSKCREATWDNTLAISRGQEREEGKKKKKKKKKKKREKWGKMTTIYSISFLFLSSSFPYSLLFLIFPSFLSVEETGKGKRESQEKERRGRGKEKERKESLLLSSSLALLFLLFIFPSLLSFFLSSLSLASLTRQAWCHMSFFKHSEAVSQKW